jgi:hypothetical protein
MIEQERETSEAERVAHEAVFGSGPVEEKPGVIAETGPAAAQPEEAEAENPGETAAGDEAARTPEEPEAEASAAEKTEPVSDTDSGRANAKTQNGRLAAAEARAQELEREVTALRARVTAPQRAEPEPETEAPKAVELPEKLQADAKEFDTLFPQWAPLLRMPGPEGDRLRRLLDLSGADIAGLAAENLVLRDQMARGQRKVESTINERAQREHLERVADAHPEVRGFIVNDPEERANAEAFAQDVLSWVESLPYNEASIKRQILQVGSGSTSSQINALLAEYKQSKAQVASPRLDDATRRRAALAAGVDNRRGSKPVGKTDPEQRIAAAHEAVFGGGKKG